MFESARICIAELEAVRRPLRRNAANELSIRTSRELQFDEPSMVLLMLAMQGSYDHACVLADRIAGVASWSITPQPAPRRHSAAESYEVRMGETAARSPFPALAIVAAILKTLVSFSR